MNIELKLTVEDLNARYAQAIDDDKLEAWPDFFIEQGRYRVTTAENFERKWKKTIWSSSAHQLLVPPASGTMTTMTC
ncbi:MAG: hypothetical protein JOY75_17195 [Hyphomicrobiales bacterium]|nr:hypothetical protein [Hyphomicrobiales bacterium]